MFREFSKRGSVGVKALDRRLVEHWTLNRRKDWTTGTVGPDGADFCLKTLNLELLNPFDELRAGLETAPQGATAPKNVVNEMWL